MRAFSWCFLRCGELSLSWWLMVFSLPQQVAPGMAGGLKRPSEQDAEGDAIIKRMKEETDVAEAKSESAE